MTWILTHKRSFILCAVLVVALAGIHACTKQDRIVLPEGPQTMTGSIHPVSISLSRRGTHMLRDSSGENMVYLESTALELSDYEDLDAVVKGVMEYNTDPNALPVLVVSEIGLPPIQTKTWEVTSLGIALDVPLAWAGQEYEDGIRFTMTGALQPMLMAYKTSLAGLPAGRTTQIGARRAMRQSGTGSELAYVRNNREVIAFSYEKNTDNADEGLQSFLRVLRTVRFVAQKSSASGSGGVTSGTGTVLGAPCGGVAGVLCPSGSYCEITDRETGIGRCRNIR